MNDPFGCGYKNCLCFLSTTYRKEITGGAFIMYPLEQAHKKSSTDKSEELELFEPALAE